MNALSAALLRELAAEPDGAAVSLPRLVKRLAQGASVLMRQLALMGEASVGGAPGPGWVHVAVEDGRWLARLTPAGRAAALGLHEGDAAEMPALASVQVEEAVLAQPPVRRADLLAAEVPVALVFNGIGHAVMMATPLDLADFALGFALSEGLLDEAAQCYGIDVHAIDGAQAGLPPGTDAVELRLEIATGCFERLKQRRRSLAGRTGCGVCGVESLAALDLATAPVPPRDWAAAIDLPVVLRAFEQLAPRQVLNAQAGTLHAAAWAGLDGAVTDVLEDVGRHNALDKLLGRLARQRRLAEPGFVLLSSRGSHELVRKCARLGVTAMATISAPTALAVQLAEQSGMQLWGMCRAPRGVRYTPR